MRVFVTRGSSPLGERVLPRLASVHAVWALARSAAAAERVDQRGVAPVRGQLESPGKWAASMRSADAVVHLAGLQLVDLIIGHVDHQQPLTVISSASVRSTAHARSLELRAAEARLAAAKPEALIILRPSMIYGSSRDRNVRFLARAVARLPAVPRLVGGGAIQPVFVDDVADAVATTLGDSGRLDVDLGGPAEVRIGELVAELACLLGRRIIPVPIPVRAVAAVIELASHWRRSRAIHALAMLRHDRRLPAGGAELLGHPPTPLAEGLALALARYGVAARLSYPSADASPHADIR